MGRKNTVYSEPLDLPMTEESHLYLLSIMESMAEAVIGKDLHGIIKMWNKGAELMYGYEAREVIGQHISILVPPGRPNDTDFILEKLGQGEKILNYETVRRTKSGKTIHISLNATPVKDHNGKLIGGAVTARDITDRLKAEEALKKREYRFRQLSESGSIAIAYFDMDGRITDSNEKFLALTGFNHEDLEQELVRWDRLNPPEWMPRTLEAMEELRATGSITPYEKEYLRKDGSKFWGLFGGARLNSHGIAFVIDISENKQAEIELRQTLEREQQVRGDLQQFVYILSHDLRSPISTISNFAALISRKYGGTLDSKVKEYIDYIRESTLRMDKLIRDLLDYGRIGSRQKPLTEVDCNAILEGALSNLRTEIENAHARIVKRVCPKIMGDDALLTQLFQNLISNALKYNRRTPEIVISAEHRDNEWLFSFKDNGIGIAPEDQKRIFEPFQRGKTEIQKGSGEVPKGSGLGLSIVKKIVETHGGHIWVESVVDEGSTFYFTLPKP